MSPVAQHTVLQAGDSATPELFTSLGDVVSITGPSLSCEPVDVTDVGSTAKAYLSPGVYDGGEVTVELNWDADLATQLALITRVRAGTQINYQIGWPNFVGTALAFVAADVNVGADTITEAGHGLTTGQPVQISTDDTIPAPLVASTTYYVIWVDANTIMLATTNALAVAATQIDLTTQGVGNHAIQVGDRYDFAASVTGAEPTGTQSDKLTGTITFKVTDVVTP